jgi:DNA primase
MLCKVDRLLSGLPVPQDAAHRLAGRIVTVTANEAGRRSCPFQPPDRHPSFAVNRELGYWVCFHQINPQTGRYLGGDAIEFYRRLKGLGFKEAVHELAGQCGLDEGLY